MSNSAYIIIQRYVRQTGHINIHLLFSFSTIIEIFVDDNKSEIGAIKSKLQNFQRLVGNLTVQQNEHARMIIDIRNKQNEQSEMITQLVKAQSNYR